MVTKTSLNLLDDSPQNYVRYIVLSANEVSKNAQQDIIQEGINLIKDIALKEIDRRCTRCQEYTLDVKIKDDPSFLIKSVKAQVSCGNKHNDFSNCEVLKSRRPKKAKRDYSLKSVQYSEW